MQKASLSQDAGCGHERHRKEGLFPEVFLFPNQKPAIISTHNSNKLLKTCLDLPRNHDTATHHRSKTKGVAARAVRRMKVLQSHLFKAVHQFNGGVARWNDIVTYGMRKTGWLMAKRHSKTLRFEELPITAR